MVVFQQLTPPPEKDESPSPSPSPSSQPPAIAGMSQHQPPFPSLAPLYRHSYFDQLPVEILSLIANFLEADRAATKTLRCVSKSCANVCTRLVFRNLTLLLRHQSIERLERLLEAPELCCVVEHVIIDTAQYTNTCLDDYDWDDRDAELLKSFQRVLIKMGSLWDLRSIKLKFSHECVGPQPRRRWWARGVPESIAFRTEILQRVFTALNNSKHRSPRLHALCIENLQDWSSEAVVTSADFKAVMSRVRKLELQVATEDVDSNGSAPANIEKKEPHEFFGRQLRAYWLEPVRNSLTHLKLYSRDMYFGYLPRCELPVFPALKSLTLGGMSFSHDTQMDWILAHGTTLQDLILDNCPIVIGVRIPTPLTSENYPSTPREVSSVLLTRDRVWSSHVYPARWQDYFLRLATGLPHLRSLRCGFGDWYKDSAFGSSHTLGTGLWAQRYRIFDDGEWRKPPFAGGFYDGTWSDPPLYPECTEEDWNALCEVKQAILSRCGGDMVPSYPVSS